MKVSGECYCMISATSSAILRLQGESPCSLWRGIGTWIIVICILSSLGLHGLAALGLEFQAWTQVLPKRIVLVDIVLTPSIPSPEPVRISSRSSRATRSEVPRPATIKPTVPAVKTKARNISSKPSKPRSEVFSSQATSRLRPNVPTVKAETSAQVPALFITNATPTILANESGQDSLKHGSEARFMHGVATEEFVEENYVGEYFLGTSGRIWIEDDRKRSGHLILHAEHMNFIRPLFRFNRFIYVYGENPGSPSPILGSVTFFSDGDHIHQFLWQHNSTKAYFPRKKYKE